MKVLRLLLVSSALILAPMGCGSSDDDDPDVDATVPPDDTGTGTDDDAAIGDDDASVDDDAAVEGIACGGDVCEPGQVCCHAQDDVSCIADGDPCDDGFVYECNPGAGDCGDGHLCCPHDEGFECEETTACDPLGGSCTTTSDCEGEGEVCCGFISPSCEEECESGVRCESDTECTANDAGDCCSDQGFCTDVCLGA
jgi:hypothetical protein